MRSKLVIMVKEPHPGRVKTRLGRDIGLTASAWWFRHQIGALLRRIEDPRWDTILAVAPDVEGLTSRIWPAHLPRVRKVEVILATACRASCEVSPDWPRLHHWCRYSRHHPPPHREAFKALGNHEAVFGPAPDGGYWLIGMKRARPHRADILTNVRWSSEHALTDSARSLGDVNIAHVATLRDVDTVDDLKLL